MSTRKLILLALACGMAILVAGSIQLFRIQRSDSSTLAVGDSTEVATVTASVVGAVASGESILVTVRMRVADTAASPIGDAVVGWSLLSGGLKESVEPVDNSTGTAGSQSAPVPPCAGLRVAAGTSVDCVLRFAVRPGGSGTTYVTYRFAGQQPATWSLPV